MLVLSSALHPTCMIATATPSMSTTTHAATSHSPHHVSHHPSHSTSVLCSTLHLFMNGTVLFPLVGSQQSHGGALTLDRRE
jgi:hypothetical protein